MCPVILADIRSPQRESSRSSLLHPIWSVEVWAPVVIEPTSPAILELISFLKNADGQSGTKIRCVDGEVPHKQYRYDNE